MQPCGVLKLAELRHIVSSSRWLQPKRSVSVLGLRPAGESVEGRAPAVLRHLRAEPTILSFLSFPPVTAIAVCGSKQQAIAVPYGSCF